MRLTEAEHRQVAEAITAAETRTSGEIFAIVSAKRMSYPQVAIGGAVLAAFVLPFLAVLLGFDPARLIPGYGGWAEDAAVRALRAIEAFAALQALVFVTMLALLSWTPLGLRLTPRAMRRERVHREAFEQFLAKGLHVTAARTGVLIYVSLPDHIAEVIADEGIYRKVAPETWGDTVAAVVDGVRAGRLADGFVRAIGLAGDVLAQHFPPTHDNPNELPDKLIEL